MAFNVGKLKKTVFMHSVLRGSAKGPKKAVQSAKEREEEKHGVLASTCVRECVPMHACAGDWLAGRATARTLCAKQKQGREVKVGAAQGRAGAQGRR